MTVQICVNLTKISWKLQWLFSLGIALIHLKSIAIPRGKSHCKFHGKFSLHYKILPYSLFSKPYWNIFFYKVYINWFINTSKMYQHFISIISKVLEFESHVGQTGTDCVVPGEKILLETELIVYQISVTSNLIFQMM